MHCHTRIGKLTGPLFVCLIVQITGSASASTFYFSPDGHDTADGLTPGTAWKSLGQVWAAKPQPGDQILLRRGGMWHESLTFPADGSADKPIVVATYGDGDRPVIDGGDAVDPARFTADAGGNFVVELDHPVSEVWTGSGPMTEVKSAAELKSRPGTFRCEGGRLSVHPEKDADPRRGQFACEIPSREFGIEISKSHVVVRSISVRHAGRVDRGAVTVWADKPITGIEIADCDITANAGRGIWCSGPAGSAVHEFVIKNNQFVDNDSSGILITLGDGVSISGNRFARNCRRPIEPWQGAVRLWSAGIANTQIRDNTITDQRWNSDHDTAMGIHIDETGPHVVVADNLIRNVDHAGIAVENCRGVTVERNIVIDANIGIFINRAGHDHLIRQNQAVDCRSQGIAISGWLAHGVDAQPEITVDGKLMTRNRFENNKAVGSRYGNFKATSGGENVDGPLANIFSGNDLGAERAGFIEWGDKTFDRYDQWPVKDGGSHGSVGR